MDLTSYRTLGRSGLVVSPLTLGTMTFGNDAWGSTDAEARSVFDAYLDAGGNVVDTADMYSGGRSEELVGRFVADRGARDQTVITTKSGFFAGASGNPNGGGNGRKHVRAALEGSLRRLGTDYVDLYWMHVWDTVTPVEEIVQTFSDLVREGKVRYWGLSDSPAWVVTKAAMLAQANGVPGPIALQAEYSLVDRSIEREQIPAASDGGLGVCPWSPLGAGFLTGKYTRGGERPGRLGGDNPFGDSKFTERNWTILDTLRDVAGDRPLAPVALAWAIGRPGVASTVVGARTLAQIESNLSAFDVDLSDDERARLDSASALHPDFSHGVLTPEVIRAAVFGGSSVDGRGA